MLVGPAAQCWIQCSLPVHTTAGGLLTMYLLATRCTASKSTAYCVTCTSVARIKVSYSENRIKIARAGTKIRRCSSAAVMLRPYVSSWRPSSRQVGVVPAFHQRPVKVKQCVSLSQAPSISKERPARSCCRARSTSSRVNACMVSMLPAHLVVHRGQSAPFVQRLLNELGNRLLVAGSKYAPQARVGVRRVERRVSATLR